MKNEKIVLFSYYRIVAAYFVLLIHQQFWNMWPMATGFKNAAVPLFAAMSGFLFSVRPDKGCLEDLKNKVKRILVPYTVWALVYFVANNVVLDGFVKHQKIVVPGLESWLLGGTACHLWFLPALFLAFMAAIILRQINVEKFIGVIFVVLGAASSFLSGETSASFSGYCRIYLGRLILFFGLGYFCGQMRISDKAAKVLGFVSVIIGGGVILGRCALGISWQPLIFILGLLLIAKGQRSLSVPAWIEELAGGTMGIYLVHVLFVSFANFVLMKMDCMPLSPWLGFPLTVVLFVMSYFSVYFLPKWIKG